MTLFPLTSPIMWGLLQDNLVVLEKNYIDGIHCLLQILMNFADIQGNNMILLDCYCALTYTERLFSFLCVFGVACKQQLIANLYILLEILRLYFPFCYPPVLLFLCRFACSPSFLLFHFYNFFVYKLPSSVLKKGVFLGHKDFGQKFSEDFASRPPFFMLLPEIFPSRTAPGQLINQLCQKRLRNAPKRGTNYWGEYQCSVCNLRNFAIHNIA